MPKRPEASLLPREHGAYAQLGISLAAGASLGPDPRGWLLALAAAAVFLATEPALVLAGRRGASSLAVSGRRARRRLVILCSLGTATAGIALWGAQGTHLLALLPSLILGLGLGTLFLRRREHSALGETLGALAFSLAALPTALRAGAPADQAVSLAGILALLHILGTWLVRGHLWSLGKGLGPLPRLLAASLIVAAAAVLALQPLGGLLRGSLLPLVPVALGVALVPPAPNRFRMVGWLLAAASSTGTLLAVLGLRF